MKRPAVFAVPGDLDAPTGGYIYEKQVLIGLRRLGRPVAHLALPGSFPEPTADDLAVTAAALGAIPPDTPVILDGFLPGATPPEILAELRAPFLAVTHHPLALETGRDPARAAELHRIEGTNLARAAHILVPSPHTATTLAAEFGISPRRITVGPPGVVRAPAPSGQSPGPPHILSVGQLVPRKGHDVLLRALAQLRDRSWQAEIVGGATDPDCAAGLRELRDTLGLGSRVTFAGSVSPAALAKRYAAASIFALATRYEGYGMVFAEALANGLPIVASAGGAAADTVPPEAGLLAPVDDVAAFAAHLARLLDDPGERARRADAARRHGDALPTWDDTARLADAALDLIAR